MAVVSMESRKKSWQGSRERVSVLAALAIHKRTVVEKLAALRDEHDLTQEKAAQAVGVTMRQWQRWEGGESVPYPRNLDAIASHFGFDVSEFFTDPPASSSINGRLTQLDKIERLLLAIAAKVGVDPAILSRDDPDRARLADALAGLPEEEPPADPEDQAATG